MIAGIKLKYKNFFQSGHERTIKVKKNIALSFLLKGLSIASMLVLIPITISYVNPTQYGIWLILSSIIGWFSFFDIGLGNGLKNKLAEINALGDYTGAKVYVSTTYAILGVISACLFLVFFVVNHFLNWATILNVTNTQHVNFNNIALIVFGFFCIQFIFQLINTILTATHAPFKVSLTAVIGQLLSLAAIYTLTITTQGSLLYLILALAGIPLFVQLIASIWYFSTTYKLFAPNFKSVNFKYAKGLLGAGSLFFIIQIGALVLFQTDNIIVTQLFGPKEVTVFNVAYRLFSVVNMIFMIIMLPFWSSFTDAYIKNDLAWIKSIVKKMNRFLVLIVLFTSILFISSTYIYKIWLHGTVAVPLLLSLAMAVNVVATCWQTLHVYLLNGIGKIRLQLYLVVACSIINIPLAFWLGKRIGLAGVTVANIVVIVIIAISLSIQTKKILNNTATGIFNK